MSTATLPMLTPRQRQVYDFIRSETRNRGYPPTIREIGREVGIPNTNGVMCHLRPLERKGYIRRTPGLFRSITLVDDAPATGPSPETLLLRELRAMAIPRSAPGRPPYHYELTLTPELMDRLTRLAGGVGHD